MKNFKILFIITYVFFGFKMATAEEETSPNSNYYDKENRLTEVEFSENVDEFGRMMSITSLDMSLQGPNGFNLNLNRFYQANAIEIPSSIDPNLSNIKYDMIGGSNYVYGAYENGSYYQFYLPCQLGGGWCILPGGGIEGLQLFAQNIDDMTIDNAINSGSNDPLGTIALAESMEANYCEDEIIEGTNYQTYCDQTFGAYKSIYFIEPSGSKISLEPDYDSTINSNFANGGITFYYYSKNRYKGKLVLRESLSKGIDYIEITTPEGVKYRYELREIAFDSTKTYFAPESITGPNQLHSIEFHYDSSNRLSSIEDVYQRKIQILFDSDWEMEGFYVDENGNGSLDESERSVHYDFDNLGIDSAGDPIRALKEVGFGLGNEIEETRFKFEYNENNPLSTGSSKYLMAKLTMPGGAVREYTYETILMPDPTIFYYQSLNYYSQNILSTYNSFEYETYKTVLKSVHVTGDNEIDDTVTYSSYGSIENGTPVEDIPGYNYPSSFQCYENNEPADCVVTYSSTATSSSGLKSTTNKYYLFDYEIHNANIPDPKEETNPCYINNDPETPCVRMEYHQRNWGRLEKSKTYNSGVRSELTNTWLENTKYDKMDGRVENISVDQGMSYQVTTDYDTYGINPISINYTGGELTKTVSLEWWRNTKRWIYIGKLKKKREKINDSEYLTKEEYVYDSGQFANLNDGLGGYGLIVDEYRNGLKQNSYSYDYIFDLISRTDAIGNMTTLSNFEYGQPKVITDSIGSIYNCYNTFGQATSHTDGRISSFPGCDSITSGYEYTTSLKYDYLGRVTLVDYPNEDSPSTVITYAKNDAWVRERTGSSVSIREYDDLGRLRHVINEKTEAIEKKYNALGIVTRECSYVGFKLEQGNPSVAKLLSCNYYDDRGRLQETEVNTGLKETYDWDDATNTLTKTDFNKQSWIYEYDSINPSELRLTSVNDPLGNVTVQEYNDKCNSLSKVKVIPQGGTEDLERINWFDSYCRLDSSRTPEISGTGDNKVKYTYYNDGKTWTVENVGSTDKLSYEYDARRRLKKVYKVNSSNTLFPKSELGYDKANNVIWGKDYDSTIILNRDYDESNRLKEIWYDIPESGKRVSYKYTYYSTGTLATTYLNLTDRTISYSYNNRNNVISVYNSLGTNTSKCKTKNCKTTEGSLISAVQYYETNTPSNIKYGNGNSKSIGIDERYRMNSIKDTIGSGNLTNHTYFYDNDNNLTTISDLRLTSNGAGGREFEYDELGRLKIQNITNVGVMEYPSYSSLGHRLVELKNGETVDYDYTNNRLDSVSIGTGVDSYSWNENTGRLSSITKSGANAKNLEYDVLGNLTSIDNRSYRYDGFGMRLYKVYNGQRTYYLHDASGNEIVEIDTSGNVIRESVYSGIREFPLLGKYDSSAKFQYYHTDIQGTVLGLSDESAKIICRNEFDAWGNKLSTTSPCSDPFGWKGERLDDTGLVYLRARYYDPNTGRFLSSDPKESSAPNPQNMNRYAFGLNNPNKFSDPTGMTATDDNTKMVKPDIKLKSEIKKSELHGNFDFKDDGAKTQMDFRLITFLENPTIFRAISDPIPTLFAGTVSLVAGYTLLDLSITGGDLFNHIGAGILNSLGIFSIPLVATPMALGPVLSSFMDISLVGGAGLFAYGSVRLFYNHSIGDENVQSGMIWAAGKLGYDTTNW